MPACRTILQYREGLWAYRAYPDIEWSGSVITGKLEKECDEPDILILHPHIEPSRDHFRQLEVEELVSHTSCQNH